MSNVLNVGIAGLTRMFGTDVTDDSITDPDITLTKPEKSTTNGVFTVSGGGAGPVMVRLAFYGTGADNATGSFRLYGWAPFRDTGLATPADVWVPMPLLELDFTLSTDVGIAGSTFITASHRWADTITVVSGVGNDGVDVRIISPTGNVKAHAVAILGGYEIYEGRIADDGSATAVNCMFGAY